MPSTMTYHKRMDYAISASASYCCMTLALVYFHFEASFGVGVLVLWAFSLRCASSIAIVGWHWFNVKYKRIYCWCVCVPCAHAAPPLWHGIFSASAIGGKLSIASLPKQIILPFIIVKYYCVFDCTVFDVWVLRFFYFGMRVERVTFEH